MEHLKTLFNSDYLTSLDRCTRWSYFETTHPEDPEMCTLNFIVDGLCKGGYEAHTNGWYCIYNVNHLIRKII